MSLNRTRKSDFQKCGVDAMSALAAEMQGIVFRASEPLLADEKVKARMRRAHKALQLAVPSRPLKFWRVKAAWEGEAGSWVGVAHEDFRERSRVLQHKIEAGRARANELASIFATAAERLRTIDPDFYREQIAEHECAAREVGSLDSTGAESLVRLPLPPDEGGR